VAFTVEFVAVPSREFGDKDKLEFLEGGVLKIARQDKTNLYFSPNDGRPSVRPRRPGRARRYIRGRMTLS
jgi:hypothetical protein